MTDQEVRNLLRKIELFSDMTEEALQKMAALSHYKILKKDEVLVKEGSLDEYIYIIAKGRFFVYKHLDEQDKTGRAEFGILEVGDTVGELAFLDEKPRSASVRALENNSTVIRIKRKDMLEFASIPFYRKLAKKLSHHIRAGNEKIVQNLRIELEQTKKIANMGRFLTYILLLISFYILALKGFVTLYTNPYTSMFASTSIIFIFTVVMVALVHNMGYSFAECGINLNRWQKSLAESLFFTFLIILILTGIKAFLIDSEWIGKHLPLIDLKERSHFFKGSLYSWLLPVSIYSLFVIFQEFIARGVLLGTLQNFLQQKHKNLLANIISSGVFASMHIHLSTGFALAVFLPSLFWGWLYIRQGSLLGPIISHILIGVWAIFFLGLTELLG